LVVSTSADADALFPPVVSATAGNQVTEQIFEPLAALDQTINVIGDKGFIPQLADRWEWGADSLSIIYHLNPKARWHDGVPVTARDVQYTFRVYRDSALASPIAADLRDLDSITVRDSLTPVVWLKHHLPRTFYAASSEMLIIPEHVYGKLEPAAIPKSDVARHPIGSGPFKLVRWVPNSIIEIAANTEYYRQRAMLDRVIWTIAPGDFSTAVTRLLRGEADFFEIMRPESIREAAKGNLVRVTTFPGMDMGMMLFNLRDTHTHSAPHPIFSDVRVRRALTMAIDRIGIVKNVFDSLAAPAIGPSVRAMSTTDTTIAQIPYDPAAAERLLDSLGWKKRADGVRAKNGKPLAFAVITPTSSKNRQQCAVLIQEQLRKIGVQLTIQPMEIGAFLQHENARDFDAAMISLHFDPSPVGLKQSWGAAEAANPHGSNYASYVNPTFDAQVDSALAVSSIDGARAAFSKAYKTIIDDAPAVWIYDLRSAVGMHKRIHPGPLHANAWWAELSRWSIPDGERIARDNVAPR